MGIIFFIFFFIFIFLIVFLSCVVIKPGLLPGLLLKRLYSVQLFRSDGVCIQRLGDKVYGKKMNQFDVVFGISVMNDRLYVSDFGNDRIQIFK